MNRHLKRGLVASLIVFSLVAIAGAISIYFDPPIDVPSVGYYALGLLVKAVLALSMGAGFGMFVLVALGSAIFGNASKGWVSLVMLGAIHISCSTYFYILQPPKHHGLNQEKQY
jgi:hypothetical protein